MSMMVSSDLNIHDELDASDSSVILQYETRLQAKSNGRRWYFSHPSVAGFGVDTYWQQSDKKEWFRYVPSNESEEKMAYAWRVSARNYLNNLEMFPDFSLHDSVFNNNLDYDEWKLKMDSENIKVKIYVNGNQIVKSESRMYAREYEWE